MSANPVDTTIDQKTRNIIKGLYDDLQRLKQIVRNGGSGGGIPDAPKNGKQYDRQDGNWSEIQKNLIESIPIGAVIQCPVATIPTGFLLCDGSSVSTTSYPQLFAALGYSYGGSGANFNLPDMRGKAPVGKDAATFASLGGVVGAEKHTLTVAEMPAHSHNMPLQQGSLSVGSALLWQEGQTRQSWNDPTITGVTQGNSLAHNNTAN